MALDVGLALHIDPRLIMKEWYPYQLCSVYAQVINEKWARAYVNMDDKEKLKHPEVMVKRILSEEELKKFVEQKSRKVVKSINSKKVTKK